MKRGYLKLAKCKSNEWKGNKEKKQKHKKLLSRDLQFQLSWLLKLLINFLFMFLLDNYILAWPCKVHSKIK
jgi:hypothetical protein